MTFDMTGYAFGNFRIFANTFIQIVLNYCNYKLPFIQIHNAVLKYNHNTNTYLKYYEGHSLSLSLKPQERH